MPSREHGGLRSIFGGAPIHLHQLLPRDECHRVSSVAYKHAINLIDSGAAPLDGRSARLVPAPALAGDGDEEAVS